MPLWNDNSNVILKPFCWKKQDWNKLRQLCTYQTLEQNQAYTDEEMKEFEDHLVQQEQDLYQKADDLQKQRDELERQQEQLNAQKVELQQVRTRIWLKTEKSITSVEVSREQDVAFVGGFSMWRRFPGFLSVLSK